MYAGSLFLLCADAGSCQLLILLPGSENMIDTSWNMKKYYEVFSNLGCVSLAHANLFVAQLVAILKHWQI